MQFRFSIASILSSLAIAPFGLAQGVYVDGGYSAISTDIDFEFEDVEADYDLNFGLAGGHVGYDFSPYFGVEAELYFSVQDDSQTETYDIDGDETDVQVSYALNYLAGGYAKGNLPLGDMFTVFARAGYVTSELEATVDVEDSASISDTDEALAFGVGGTFNLTEQIYARGDYTRYEFDEVALDAFMASVGFRF